MSENTPAPVFFTAPRRNTSLLRAKPLVEDPLDWIYLFIAVGILCIPSLLFYATFTPSPAREILAAATAVGAVFLVRYSPRISRAIKKRIRYWRISGIQSHNLVDTTDTDHEQP